MNACDTTAKQIEQAEKTKAQGHLSWISELTYTVGLYGTDA